MSRRNINGFRRKLLVGLASISIVALLGASFVYYFSKKEQKLEERNFRVLNRIERSLNWRIREYRNYVFTQVSALYIKGDQANKKVTVPEIDSVLTSNIKQRMTVRDKVTVAVSDSIISALDWEIESGGQSSVIAFHFGPEEFESSKQKAQYLTVRIPSEPILRSVLRYDVFPNYFLGSKQGVCYNNCPEVSQLDRIDSLDRFNHIQTLRVGNGKYYIFSHPLTIKGGEGLILSGMVSADKYNQAKFNIPGNFLLFIFLLFLLVLLAFPFIKSFLVSSEETLKVSDVFFSILSLFALCYLFVFIHLTVFTVTRDAQSKKEMLRSTANNINDAFLNEIVHMRDQLREYDRNYKNNPDSPISKPEYYAKFHRIAWIDKSGNIEAEIKPSYKKVLKKSGQSEASFKDRQYFRAVSQNELWFPESADSDKIFLEPVYSRNDNSFRGVIGMKSRLGDSVVAAISSQMKSVIDPILPREIGFCLINTRGDIQFTSLGREHLRENFREECESGQAIGDALNSRAGKYMNQTFMGRDYSVYIRPIDSLPLYLVTLSDNEFTGNTQLQVGIYTSLFILLILACITLVFLAIIFYTRKKRNDLLGRQYLDVSQIFPASQFQYREFAGLLMQLFLIGALVVSGYLSRNDPFTLTVLMLVSACGMSASVCYKRLTVTASRNVLFWSALFIILVFADFILYFNGEAYQNIPAFVSLIVFEILVVTAIWLSRKPPLWHKSDPSFNLRNTHAQDILNSGSLSGFKKSYWLFNWLIRKFFGHNLTFYNQYSLVLVFWFCLTTIIPTIFAYRYVYKNEIEYRIRSAQIDLARKIFERDAYRRDKQVVERSHNAIADSQVFAASYFSTRFEGFTGGQVIRKQELVFDSLLSTYRLSWNKGIDSPGTALSGSYDNTIRFSRDNDKLLFEYQNLLNHPGSQTQNDLKIVSTVPAFPIPEFHRQNLLPLLVFYLLPVAFLIALFYIINFFLKRFFLFEILPQTRNIDKNLFERIYRKYTNATLRLFIVGVTASGKKRLVSRLTKFIENKKREAAGENTKPGTVSMEFVDLAEINTQIIESYKLKKIDEGGFILLNHFEHNLADDAINKQKFQLISILSARCAEEKGHLVILSNIHPSVFLNNQNAKSEAGNFNAEDYINSQNYYNWTGLLSRFQIIIKYFPEKKTVGDPLDREGGFDIYEKSKRGYIFYLSIWNSLDRIEKFVAYDLAQDGLVNYRNKAAVYSLYSKGLIVMKDIPELMNEEFRTFILTEISEADVELEKQQSGHRSAWDMFRIPFLVIVIAALAFVFFTQQETFNKLTAGLAAVAGSIPLLLKLFTHEKKPA